MLLRLEVPFCSIQLHYEFQFFLSVAEFGIYGVGLIELNLILSTVEKCAVVIFDNEKIQKVKLNYEDMGFVDIKFDISHNIRLGDLFDHQELVR